ncbi:MAG: hypothetical protein D6812_18030, partial [Deltaproteobacteria bacterium]
MMEEKPSKSTPELLEILIEQMRSMVRQQTQTNERLDHVAHELRTGLAATNERLDHVAHEVTGVKAEVSRLHG